MQRMKEDELNARIHAFLQGKQTKFPELYKKGEHLADDGHTKAKTNIQYRKNKVRIQWATPYLIG